MRRYAIRSESWELKQPFVISKLTQYSAEVAVVEIEEDGVIGRGECERADVFEPHLPDVLAALEEARPQIESGIGRVELLAAMPAGPARAAVDFALWELEAKQAGKRVWELAGLEPPEPLTTAFTLGLDTPEAMAAAATRNADRPLLKLKLGAKAISSAQRPCAPPRRMPA